MSSHSVTLLFSKTPPRFWLARPNWHCNKRDWSLRTSKRFSPVANYRLSILRNSERLSAWVLNARLYWLEEKHLVDHWRVRHALRFTPHACPPGNIGCALAPVGFLGEPLRVRYCRWASKGSPGGASGYKSGAYSSASNRCTCDRGLHYFPVGARPSFNC